MKRHQVNSILVNQTKRRNTVFEYICMIIFIFLIVVASFMLYVEKNKSQYVKYNEKSNINYQVYYKENEFFENKYVESNKQYIASLIENIQTEFNYQISLEEKDVEYQYTYNIEADIIVRDKDTKKSFYEKKETLLAEVKKTTSKKEVEIKENLIIDYNSYNDKIKKMVKVYDLENAESFLNINMFINVVGSCEEFDKEPEKKNVISLSIPLTEDTIAIDFIDNTVNSTNNIMQCKQENSSVNIFIALGILLSVIDLALVISVIKYEIKTRTAETIYEKELKKILNNYGSIIQMLGNEFDFTHYQLLRIDTFTDILEISDKLRQPILMNENKERNVAYFVIPSNTKLLYVYRLKVSDIEKEIKEKNKNI